MTSSWPGQKNWITSTLTLMDDKSDVCHLEVDSNLKGALLLKSKIELEICVADH